ncbi:Gfo/Idh/MocA family oxidoreductase [candidate division NPL-UPA2 bacterium]|nr:Gfo/Idh/MocA family oxidoreductase [candidate division NPL-UPA2 bacterium]
MKTPLKQLNTTPPLVTVVGSGHWGKNLIRNFHQLGNLKTICDSSPQRQKEFAAKYPQVNIESDFNQVLNDPEIKGIVLATPAETHFALAKLAMEHDKDVLVEKPLCLHPAEGQQLCELAKQKNKILMVGHLLHYHPAIRAVKEMVFSGKLGKIHHIYSNRLNLGIFRQEENVMWSFAPHDISVILSLIPELPTRLSATGTATLNPKLPDTVHLKMSFADGLYANIFVSWLHPFKEQKMVITGDRGMLVFDDTKKPQTPPSPRSSVTPSPTKNTQSLSHSVTSPATDSLVSSLAKNTQSLSHSVTQSLVYYCEPISWDSTKPSPNRQEPEAVPIDNAEPLKEECLAFVQAIKTRKQPLTPGEEGLKVLKVLSAAQQSLDNNGAWIELKAVCGKTNSNPPSPTNYFAHPTAVIDSDCHIGTGTKIWHFSHIMPEATIGENCNIGQNVVISPGVKLGKNVKIQNNVSVYTGVVCEDDVFLGPSMVFTNIKNPRSHISRRDQYTPTLIKKGATIGANATIICGIEIGIYALIGAGAVVTKDVPAHAVVYGNPAEIKGWVCQCGNTVVERKQDKSECGECGD